MREDARNISTEHQKEGDAKRPSDTLNRDRPAPPKEDAEAAKGDPKS